MTNNLVFSYSWPSQNMALNMIPNNWDSEWQVAVLIGKTSSVGFVRVFMSKYVQIIFTDVQWDDPE